MGEVLHYLHEACYVWLAMLALWGVYCVIMAWTRVNRKKFRNEQAMMAFFAELEEPLNAGDIEGAVDVCEGDNRALPQLVHVALVNRNLTLQQIKELVLHKLQHEVLGDVQVRLTWIGTIIKAAPMVGLLGTVLSMMGAFMVMSEGGDGGGAKDAALAGNIMVALSATAMGLCIAITMMITVAPVNNRIRKLEDLVSYGLSRFFETFKRIHGQSEPSPPRMLPETADARFR
jgi:biopolymer transport protein ExbB/TolQ